MVAIEGEPLADGMLSGAVTVTIDDVLGNLYLTSRG